MTSFSPSVNTFRVSERQRHSGWLYHNARDIDRLLRLLDPLGILLNLFIWQAFGSKVLPGPYFIAMASLVLLLTIWILPIADVYRSFRQLSLWILLRRITLGWLGVLGISLFVGYLTKTSEFFSREFILYWAISSWTLLLFQHVALRKWLRWQRALGQNSRSAVFWGTAEQSEQFWRICQHCTYLGIRPEAWFGPTGNNDCFHYGGSFDDFCLYLDQHNPDLVYLGDSKDANDMSRLFRVLGDRTRPVFYLPYWSQPTMAMQLQQFGDQTAIAIWNQPQSSLDQTLKRLVDLSIAGLAVVVLSPIFMAIALGIALSSSGPLLFRQRRYGLNGEEFIVYKFRTMTVLEDGPTILQASRDDKRITPIGRWLRRTSLDEIPQLFNVLEGSMSLVGPRPHAVAHNETYRKLISGYMTRHMLKPGMTGLAQIRGYRGETKTLKDMEARVEADLEYLHNWSLTLDLKILFLTLFRWRSPNAY